MEGSAWTWLLITLICLVVQAFFNMVEMACISFNKVRLQYWVSSGNQRAVWINTLIKNPSRLFGTTLLAVNTALQIGSECSREFYGALGLSPDLAPLSQIFIVLIFAELSPMIAARRYPEHVAMLGIPVLVAVSKLAYPLLFCLEKVYDLSGWILGSKERSEVEKLSREELQNILEEQEDIISLPGQSKEFNATLSNIFAVKSKTAQMIMEPLKAIRMLHSAATIGDMRQVLVSASYPFIPIYHQSRKNIVGIVYPRDLIRYDDLATVKEHSRTPWFITQSTPILHILKQFRRNNQTVAIILNNKGEGVGLLSLKDLLDHILEPEESLFHPHHKQLMIGRSFSGEMYIEEFNKQFGTQIKAKSEMTLSDLFIETMGHLPETGDTIRLQGLEMKATETTFMGVKTVVVKTLIH